MWALSEKNLTILFSQLRFYKIRLELFFLSQTRTELCLLTVARVSFSRSTKNTILLYQIDVLKVLSYDKVIGNRELVVSIDISYFLIILRGICSFFVRIMTL
jgi:hypothetical protein